MDSAAWDNILQGAATKAVDLAFLRQTMKAMPPPPPAAPVSAIPAPGLDGQPISQGIDGRWLLGGALLLALVLGYKAIKG